MGDIVKVLPKQNKIYRGKILKTHKDEWYDVLNIDIGSIEKVPSNCIYELSEELQEKV